MRPARAERRALLREANAAIVAQVRGYYARPWAEGDAESVVREALHVLREREIVRAVATGVHVFNHALARDVAYAGIAKADRAHRHAAAVEWATASMPGVPASLDPVPSS